MLVEPVQLKQWIDEDKVSVFDCRFSLQDKSKGQRLYAEAHLPHAFYLDLETDLSDPASAEAGRHPLPNPLTFAARMSEYGASDDKLIVFYDDGEGMAARGWWLMRFIGHENVYLLNGGYSRWVAEGFPVVDAVPVCEPGSLQVRVQEHMIVSEQQIEEIAAGGSKGLLVDARAAVRYRGEQEPIDAKGGHIPSAKNAPWTDGLDEHGTWLSPEQQKQRFQGLLESEEPVIHYCGSGVTACNNLFAMELSGIKGAKLYPGSWSQWCNKEYHPVSVGND